MIAAMRKFAKSRTFNVMLWFFIAIMTLGGGGLALFVNKETKNWAIKAYNEVLSIEKFNVMLSQLKEQKRQYRQKGYVAAHENVTQEAIKAGVSSLLVDHAINQIGFVVPDEYAQQMFIQKMQYLAPQFINAAGKVDLQALQQAIAPVSVADLESDIIHELSNNLLFSLIHVSAYAANYEIQLLYNLEYAYKEYAYIIFGFEYYLNQAKTQNVSDDQLEKFYKQPEVSNAFKSAEKRAGKMWAFTPSDFGIQISDSEVKMFYDKNKTEKYLAEPAKAKIRRLLIKDDQDVEEAKAKIQELHQAAMKNPESFEELVRTFSQDPKVTQTNGLSDYFDQNNKEIDASILEVVFGHLHQNGQISHPLKTKQGFEIVQKIDSTKPKYTDFKIVESMIKKDLLSAKFKTRFTQDASRVASQAKYNKDSFNSFVKRYQGMESEIALQAFGTKPEVSALFKTEQGRYTVFVDNNVGYIVLCNEIEKSKLPTLSDVRSAVLMKFYEKQAQQLLISDLEKATRLIQTESIQSVAKQFGHTVHHAKYSVNNGIPEVTGILKNQAVAQKRMAMTYPGSSVAVQSDKNGYLLQLEKITVADSKDEQEHWKQLKDAALYMNVYQNRDSFIASLYRNAKINNKLEIKQDLIKDTKEV